MKKIQFIIAAYYYSIWYMIGTGGIGSLRFVLFHNIANQAWRVVYGVAYHETGGFTSPGWKDRNNPFGMRVPSQRKSFGIVGESNNYAIYSCVWMAVKDYFEWYKYHNIEIWRTANMFDDTGNGFDYQTWIADAKQHNYFEAPLASYIAGVENGIEKSYNLTWTPSVVVPYVLLPSTLVSLFLLIKNRKKIVSWFRKKLRK